MLSFIHEGTTYSPATHSAIFKEIDPAGHIAINSTIFITSGAGTTAGAGIIPTIGYVGCDQLSLVPATHMGAYADTYGTIDQLAVQFNSTSPV